MRKLWSVVALLVVLGGLLGAYLYLDKHPLDEKKDAAASENKLEVLKLDKNYLIRLSITNDKGSFTLEKKNNKWELSQKQDMKLDDLALANLEDNFSDLKADKLIEKNPEDIDNFGLKNPRITGVALLQDGSTKTVLIGNKTVDNNSYYAMIKGSPEVYIISASTADYFNYSLKDVRSKDLTAVDTQDIKYMKLVNASGKAVEIKLNEQQSAQEKPLQLNAFMMTKPYAEIMGVDTEKFNSLLEKISQLKIVDFVDDSSKDLSKYGLDKPSFELSVKDGKNELHLYFGKEINGNIAFKVAGTSEVYSMEKQRVDELNVSSFDLLNKTSFMPFIETVDTITIDNNGKKDNITAAKGSDNTSLIHKLNDKEVDKDKFQSFYQSLIGINIDAENDKVLQGKSEVKITYSLNQGQQKTKTLDFVSYNQDFYVLFMNGKSEFLVSKSKVQDMLKQLEALR